MLKTDRFVGVPDLLVKSSGKSKLGDWSYKPSEIKTSKSVKPFHALQVCFYAMLLESTQGCRPGTATIVLADKREETLDLDEFWPEFEKQLARATAIVDRGMPTDLAIFSADFHWSPHLTPTDEHIISEHVFRAPALVVSGEGKQLTILPDIDIIQQEAPVNWYMDMDAINNKLSLGLSQYKVREHVLFVRDSGAVYPPGKLEFGFYMIASDKAEDFANPWRKILSFYWDNWGRPLFESGEPSKGSLEPYVEHTYNWAFDYCIWIFGL